MKQLKKLLALLLVLAMVLAMTACGDSDDDGDSKKKGDSRKSQATEEPTEKPNDNQNPTETPTETPTEKPTEAPTPTPTEVPTVEPTLAPGENVSFDKIKGVWKCHLDLDGDKFAEMYDDDSVTMMFDLFKKNGYNPVIKMDFSFDFFSEEEVKVVYSMNGTEMVDAMKKVFSNEDALFSFLAAQTGMDLETIKAYMAMSGMSTEDLLASLKIDEMAEELTESDEKTLSYEVNGNEITLDSDGSLILQYVPSRNTIKLVAKPDAMGSDEMVALFNNKELTR